MTFPVTRLRRLRRNDPLRLLVRETRLSPEAFVYPLFVCPGEGVRREVRSMPGVFNLSVDEAVKEARETASLGIPAVILFGLPEAKDEVATGAWTENGIVQQATRALKRELPDLIVIGDVCLCEYTSHGHCGVVRSSAGAQSLGAAVAATPSITGDYEILNDATLELLARTSVSLVQAGVDIVAPSDMMDGRVGRIRETLDAAGFAQAAIMAYAAKYCSAFYGPFRDAADSAPAFGDRRSHQMDPANVEEALREVALDLDEGADIVMVKPALPYLDVIRRVKDEFGVPTAAYHVSGEYAMLKAAARNGWIDEPRAMMETLTSIRRAGADIIITYYAREAARALA
jgi:porphobilinogen synthase